MVHGLTMTVLLARLSMRCSSSRRILVHRFSGRRSSSISSRETAPCPLFAAGQEEQGRDVVSAPRRRVQHGFGRLVATSDSNNKKDDDDDDDDDDAITRLTTMSHQAPVRLIPLRGATTVSQSGAAVVYLSNYGGGLLSGDVHTYNVTVEAGARLALVSQGSNRIYTASNHSNSHSGQDDVAAAAAMARMTVRVAENACLVMAPDPNTPFQNSIYRQDTQLILQHASSLVWIDWFSSGRFGNGERWKMQYLQNKTTVYMMPNNCDDNDDDPLLRKDVRPVLIDCVTLDSSNIAMNGGMDWNNKNLQINAHASVLLHDGGTASVVQQVLARFRQLELDLASPYARIRTPSTTLSPPSSSSSSSPNGSNNAETPPWFAQDCLSGRVFLSISAVPTRVVGHHDNAAMMNTDDNSTIYVARLAAESNEDLYRIFHYCLKPLSNTNSSNRYKDNDNPNKEHAEHSSLFGFEFYKDRIRAVHSSPLSSMVATKNTPAAAAAAAAAAAVDDDDDATSNNLFQHHSKSFSPHNNSSIQNVNNHDNNSSSSWWWSAFLLADSSLPTGSFAHSAGLEVAAQLGVISASNNNNAVKDVETYVHAATRSYLQQTTPTVMACHDLITAYARQKQNLSNSTSRTINHRHLNDLVASWSQWDDALQLLLVSNTTSCRASAEQGQNLLRVALQWAAAAEEHKESWEILQALQNTINNVTSPSIADGAAVPCWGHLPSVFGAVSALWKIPRSQAMTLLGYCMARDLVSAAVRLNLVGPLASVGILAAAQKAALSQGEIGVQYNGDDIHMIRMAASKGGCAPLLDAIQPCHDLLAVRLFRT